MAAFYGEILFASPLYKNYGKIIADKAYETGVFKLSLAFKDLNLFLNVVGKNCTHPVAYILHTIMKKEVEADIAITIIAITESLSKVE